MIVPFPSKKIYGQKFYSKKIFYRSDRSFLSRRGEKKNEEKISDENFISNS